MRRIMFALFCATLLLGCSKDDEPKNIDKEVEAITQVLNGEFIGSLYSSVTNTTETEELVFTPYSSTKEMMSVIDGKVEVYGTAIVTKYTNDHLLETTQNCYYSVRVAYTGAQPTVSFYPYSSSGDINDTEDKRIITILSNSSFKMRDYGLTENNDKTYTKQ